VQLDKLREKIMFQITATAPTTYQYSSLSAFNLDNKKNGNGSHTGTLRFETEDKAKEYLKKRADMYNSEDPEGTEERLAEMYNDIDQHGFLTLDAVTARIEEL
jgi:hypothetical protein